MKTEVRDIRDIKPIDVREYMYGRVVYTDDLAIDLKLKMGHAVCFDFDGVIHKYSKGWQDGEIYDNANYEMILLMHWFVYHGVPVFICSTREPSQIIKWWNDFSNTKLPYPRLAAGNIMDSVKFWDNLMVIGVTNRKLPAQLYIDDRAYAYNGQTMEEILSGLDRRNI